MSDEYEFYQGVVLRQLVVSADFAVMLRPYEKEGRINAFVLNGRIGVFIKHSAKRMSPWRFSFNIDQVSDLLDLTTAYSSSFVVFVCGDDGLVTLDVSTLYEIVSLQDTENAWVRIERPRRAQYAISGNKTELSNKIPNGVLQIIETIRDHAKKARAS
jgi:hypothetical protein